MLVTPPTENGSFNIVALGPVQYTTDGRDAILGVLCRLKPPADFTSFLQTLYDLHAPQPLACLYEDLETMIATMQRSGGFPAAGFEGWKGLTDEELISSHREGWGPSREEAVEELFHRHQNRIVRWCYRFTRDRESGLDLAQEIFMRAFRNLDRYRGECRFSTWLYVIARNLCMSALQKRAS